KRIYKIEVPDGANQFVTPVSGSNEPAGKAYSRTPTGRICNNVYDVVQFALVMDVEATQVPAILTQIQQGKLITIHQYDLENVDGVAMEEDGFIYGDVAVVRISLRGEELFLRSWTHPPKDPKDPTDRSLMPEDVKKDLGIQ